jgi:formylglycine-generating enzyme required for sulfatase activity
MEFVLVDDPGNAADSRPVTIGSNTSYLGNVESLYRIGLHEVTNAQYAAFLNAVADSDPHGLYHDNMGDGSYGTFPDLLRGGIARSGVAGSYAYASIAGRENLPVNWVSWESAARFANWMHNGRQSNAASTEYGAYDFSGAIPISHAASSKYWIPTADEWYKAAYYKSDSANAGYWTYPTQSDVAPVPGPMNSTPNQANFQADNFDFGQGVDHGDMTPVGNYRLSSGAYGTFDQAGNISEWIEDVSPIDPAARTTWGGAWRWNDSEQLRYDGRSHAPADAGSFVRGFRLASTPYATPKKIIQFGYDNPDTGYLPSHIDEMKIHPFHGTVFTAKPAGGTPQQFSRQSWGNTLFTRSQMQHAVDELQATNFGEFSENFLRMNATPGNVDWVLGDFSAVYENFETAAWIVAQGGARGIALDLEPYESPLWHYPSQANAATHSFEAYKQTAREAGRDIMLRIQQEAPDITIFLPVSYSYVWGQSQLNGNPANLSTIEYGLLPSFLDGMLAAAGQGVSFVDGFEYSYRHKTLEEFQTSRMQMILDSLPIIEDPVKYLEKFGFGFGLFMDTDHRTGGWHTDPSEFDQNWFTPEELETALKNALMVSDEYAWVYTETLTWWNANGGNPVPAAYFDAVANGYESSSPLATPGDTDLDGDVDLSDLGALASNYGRNSGVAWGNGDFDRDGDVDLSDLGALANNYGLGATAVLAAFQNLHSVPEPTISGSFVIFVLCIGARCRKSSGN